MKTTLPLLLAVVIAACGATNSVDGSGGDGSCTGAGQRCGQTEECCGASRGATCVTGIESAPICAAGCSQGSDCKSGCCITLDSGGSICAPSGFCETTTPDPTCSGYYHSCLATVDCCGVFFCKDGFCS